ncbi:hypothetical protein ACHAXR_004821 [Thalassiosira sp. AJA248-18]
MTSPSTERGYSARSIGNGLIAGYSAGICGTIAGHPLDSIKVLLQTNGGASGGPRTASRSSTSATTTMASSGHAITRASSNAAGNVAQSSSVKANVSTVAVGAPPHKQQMFLQDSKIGKRSIRSLYAGVSGPLLTVGILQSLNFAIYDSVRRVLYQHQLQSEDTNDFLSHRRSDDYLHFDNLSGVATASFVAGAATSVLSSPMMIVKTKQQLMVWGFRKAIKETYCGGRNGLRNFYTGFGMHFACDSVGRSVYMFTYELLKRKLAQAKCSEQSSNRVSTQNLSVPERMLCAASSGMACWAFIFPADVIRSKLYAQSLTSQSSPTTLDGIRLARQMVREQGFRSLYRGMGITVARAGPVAAAVLPVYDSVLEWVSS